MATAFVATVKSSGGDYTSLNSAEAALQNDLTAATIKVFSISAATTPTIAAGDTVLGQTSLATGVCVLVNADRTQILIQTIAVAAFQSAEVVQKTADAAVTVTLSDAGDSPIVKIACYSMQDTAAVTIDGWTTSATCYINITVPSAERHAGVWNTAKYYLTPSNTTALTISEDYVVVDGLQITNTSPAGNARQLISFPAATGRTNGANLITIKNNIFKSHGHATNTQIPIAINSPSVNTLIYNNIIYGLVVITNNIGINAAPDSGGGTQSVYNCTVIGGQYGIRRGLGTMVVKNCYAGGAGTACITGTMTVETNATSDTTGDVDNIAVDTNSFVNVTGGSEDFHLVAGASSLIGAGTDLSATFTTDIDGETRPTGAGTWDIGADEYATAGGAHSYTGGVGVGAITQGAETVRIRGIVRELGGAQVYGAGTVKARGRAPVSGGTRVFSAGATYSNVTLFLYTGSGAQVYGSSSTYSKYTATGNAYAYIGQGVIVFSDGTQVSVGKVYEGGGAFHFAAGSVYVKTAGPRTYSYTGLATGTIIYSGATVHVHTPFSSSSVDRPRTIEPKPGRPVGQDGFYAEPGQDGFYDEYPAQGFYADIGYRKEFKPFRRATMSKESVPNRGGATRGAHTEAGVRGAWTESPPRGAYTADNSYIKEVKPK